MFPDVLEYRARLVDLMQRQPGDLAEAVNALGLALWLERPAAGGSTAHQLVAHVRDLEALAFGPRLRRVLSEDRPRLEAFPSHHGSADTYRPDQPMAELLAEFARARSETMALLRDLPPEAWSRDGFHSPSGWRTAQWWAERMYIHVQEHLVEIRAAGEA